VEAALSLSEQNKVVLSYRSEAFSRLKPKNREKLDAAVQQNLLTILLKSNVTKIDVDRVFLTTASGQEPVALDNDLVFIFAGGELPTQFLEKTGVKITKRFGYTVKKHK
jgi:thioredoxin reductase